MKRALIYDILSIIFLLLSLGLLSYAIWTWMAEDRFLAAFLGIIGLALLRSSISFTQLAIVTTKK